MPSRAKNHAGSPSSQTAVQGAEPLVESIWSNLSKLSKGRDRTRILFTGTEGHSGTTLITSATALGLARNTGANVTVVEAHLASPSMATYLGFEPTPGLSDLLAGRASLQDCLRGVPGCGSLQAIPGGTPQRVTVGEFVTPEARECLEAVTTHTPIVLIDAPPLLEYPETRALLSHVDGVVLVLRARSSQKSAVRRAVERIEEAGVEVIGSVLNRFRSELPFSVEE